jgi:bifunctional non-homologous end joining protein LigD
MTPAMTIPAPMLATAGGKPFSSPDWLYEIKFDGYRCMAGIGSGVAELRTKNGTACTHWYPDIAQGLSKLPGGPHLIDGEACVLDDLGRSDFNQRKGAAVRPGRFRSR